MSIQRSGQANGSELGALREAFVLASLGHRDVTVEFVKYPLPRVDPEQLSKSRTVGELKRAWSNPVWDEFERQLRGGCRLGWVVELNQLLVNFPEVGGVQMAEVLCVSGPEGGVNSYLCLAGRAGGLLLHPAPPDWAAPEPSGTEPWFVRYSTAGLWTAHVARRLGTTAKGDDTRQTQAPGLRTGHFLPTLGVMLSTRGMADDPFTASARAIGSGPKAKPARPPARPTHAKRFAALARLFLSDRAFSGATASTFGQVVGCESTNIKEVGDCWQGILKLREDARARKSLAGNANSAYQSPGGGQGEAAGPSGTPSSSADRFRLLVRLFEDKDFFVGARGVTFAAIIGCPPNSLSGSGDLLLLKAYQDGLMRPGNPHRAERTDGRRRP